MEVPNTTYVRVLDCKEDRMPKNWCLQTMVPEKSSASPLDSKEIKPVILKGDQPWLFTGRLMMKLKFQYLGHLMQNADSLEKTLMLWKTEGKRRGRQKMRWLDSTTNSVDVNLSELLETVEDRGTGMLQTMKLQWVRHNLSTEKMTTREKLFQ